ncbi:MAG TPA: hypothetical protein VFC04_01055 [Actinomycetota bacterium]|nr:hypothetical protein [Actinomycetota bacterium]
MGGTHGRPGRTAAVRVADTSELCIARGRGKSCNSVAQEDALGQTRARRA